MDPAALLAPVAAAAALGRIAELETSVAAALSAGCPRATLREALLMVALFAGFPRTLDALAAAKRVGGVCDAGERDAGEREAGEREAGDRDADDRPEPEGDLPADEAQRRALFRERGRSLFDRVYGGGAGRVFTALLALDPELPHWVLEDAYGKVLSRPGLSSAERERLAVVFLCALELDNQLVGHVRGALRCGATADEVRASLDAAGGLLPDEMVERVRAELARR